MALKTVTTPGYQPTQDEQDIQRERDVQADQDLYNQNEAGAKPTIEPARAVAPDDGPQPIAQGPEPVAQQPEPAAQQPAPAADTFQASDIAGKVVEAAPAAAAVPQDQDPAVIELMRQRYGSGASPAATAATGNLTTGAPGAPSMESLLQKRLIELMGRGTTPNADDPEIAKTLQATSLAGQRAFDRNAAELAERAAYNGQSGSGATEAGRAALRQAQGETEQKITAGVYQDAANRRVAELQQTLAMSGDLLSQKEKNALQLQIAQMQDSTQRYGIGEGGRQFDAGLAEKIREYGLDAAARDAGMSASAAASAAGLDQRKYEFDKNFGLDERQQGFLEDKWATEQNANPVLAFLRSNGYLE